MKGKYGPPGEKAGGTEYHRHYSFCYHLGRHVPYSEYLRLVSPGSKYGPPGSRNDSPEVQRHRRWTQRHGWCTWDEYVERSPRLAKELDADKITERARRTRERFAAMGLVK